MLEWNVFIMVGSRLVMVVFDVQMMVVGILVLWVILSVVKLVMCLLMWMWICIGFFFVKCIVVSVSVCDWELGESMRLCIFWVMRLVIRDVVVFIVGDEVMGVGLWLEVCCFFY